MYAKVNKGRWVRIGSIFLALSILAPSVVAVSGCKTLSDAATQPAGQNTLTDEKALYAAEAAYNGVLQATNAALDAGLLKGQTASDVSAKLAVLNGLMRQARAIHAAGTNGNYVTFAFQALTVAGEIQAILSTPKTKA